MYLYLCYYAQQDGERGINTAELYNQKKNAEKRMKEDIRTFREKHKDDDLNTRQYGDWCEMDILGESDYWYTWEIMDVTEPTDEKERMSVIHAIDSTWRGNKE